MIDEWDGERDPGVVATWTTALCGGLRQEARPPLRDGYTILIACSDTDPRALVDLDASRLRVDRSNGRLLHDGRPFDGSYLIIAVSSRRRSWRASGPAPTALPLRPLATRTAATRSAIS